MRNRIPNQWHLLGASPVKTRPLKSSLLTGIVTGAVDWGNLTALGQSPVFTSFSQNGVLVCTNLAPGSVARVLEAPTVTGYAIDTSGQSHAKVLEVRNN